MSRADPEKGRADDGLGAQLLALRDGLSDLEFNRIVTTQLLPSIYKLGIALIGLLVAHQVLQGWRSSILLGISWLLVFGPALFLACLTVWRITLEVILVLFRLLDIVENLQPVIHEISGHADEIVTDLPRIKFWKSWRRDPESPSESPL